VIFMLRCFLSILQFFIASVIMAFEPKKQKIGTEECP
jgi:hypothetical protein